MSAPDPHYLLATLRSTLLSRGIDVDAVVAEFGQVRASEERARGKQFTLREHVRGLLLSQLSNQRLWGPIAKNLPRIETIFLDFDPVRLQAGNPARLIQAICELRCGNRQIKKQIHSLRENIETLNRIARDHGTMDQFVTSDEPNVIATKLSNFKSMYKLKQVGYTLALEYLRNVGIRAGKPDIHIRRVLSGERLGYLLGYPSEEEAYHLVAQLSSDAVCNPTYLDNLLWIFCAKDYGDICGAQPRCSLCGFVNNCNYVDRYGKKD